MPWGFILFVLFLVMCATAGVFSAIEAMLLLFVLIFPFVWCFDTTKEQRRIIKAKVRRWLVRKCGRAKK